MKLDLGCGPTPFRMRPGYEYFKDFVTMDVHPFKNVPGAVDIVADASEHIPLENNSVEEIICVEVFEHIPYTKFDKFLSEIYRVLIKDGFITIQCPDFDQTSLAFLRDDISEEEKMYVFHCIVGGQSHEYDVHRNIFTEKKLLDAFKKQGFSKIVNTTIEQNKMIQYPLNGWQTKYHLHYKAWK